MKAIKTVLFGAALALATTATATAEGEHDKAIKARKAQMSLYSWNLGMLGGMAKGKIAYDAAAAQAAADSLVALAKMGNAAMWPQGSDSTALPGQTRAKLEAWTTWPAIGEKSMALNKALAAMAEGAGTGVEGIQTTIGDVGKSCKGCHETYRDEKK